MYIYTTKKNSSYGDGSKMNIADRAARVTSLCAILCIFITLFTYTVIFDNHIICMDFTHESLFDLLKSQVRHSPYYEVGNTTNLVTNSSCFHLRQTTGVQYLVSTIERREKAREIDTPATLSPANTHTLASAL
jgi:hypothetical protein